jgi:hypothetical protein
MDGWSSPRQANVIRICGQHTETAAGLHPDLSAGLPVLRTCAASVSVEHRQDARSIQQIGGSVPVPSESAVRWLEKTWTATWKILLFLILWGVLCAPGLLVLDGADREAGTPLSREARLYLELLGALAVIRARQSSPAGLLGWKVVWSRRW